MLVQFLKAKSQTLQWHSCCDFWEETNTLHENITWERRKMCGCLSIHETHIHLCVSEAFLHACAIIDNHLLQPYLLLERLDDGNTWYSSRTRLLEDVPTHPPPPPSGVCIYSVREINYLCERYGAIWISFIQINGLDKADLKSGNRGYPIHSVLT